MSPTVVWYVHPYAGGPNVGRYDRPYHLCSAWSELGVRSVVITANNHHLLDEEKNVGEELNDGVLYDFLLTPKYQGNGAGRLFNMACFSLSLLWSAKRLKKRYGKPNLIIYSSPHPYAAVSVKWISFIYKAKSVFEVRDLWPLSLVELAGVSAKHPLVHLTSFFEKFSYANFDFTVSLLPCTLEYMASRGLVKSKWRYIPNGVSLVHKNNEDLSEEYQCLEIVKQWRKNGDFVIAYTGALGKPNNVDSLIESIRIVKNGRVRVILVGRGEMEGMLRKKIADYGISDRVFIFEQVPKFVVLRLLRVVDIGYISLLSQPIFRFGISPNKLYDYMQASLPVLFAVKCGNNPVLDSGCGLTVDPENVDEIAAKIDLLSSLTTDDLKVMGDRGFRKVQADHDYRHLAGNYLELLN